MNQLTANFDTYNSLEMIIQNCIANTMKDFQIPTSTSKEWMSIKEACLYIGVSYNTFMKYREMGLKVCEIEGVKRVSKEEIDIFLNQYSY